MNIELDTARQSANVLKALGHPARLQIISLLSAGHLTVSQIMEKLHLKQSIVSQHLNMMKDKGILMSSRQGARVFYSIANPCVLHVLECICKGIEGAEK